MIHYTCSDSNDNLGGNDDEEDMICITLIDGVYHYECEDDGQGTENDMSFLDCVHSDDHYWRFGKCHEKRQLYEDDPNMEDEEREDCTFEEDGCDEERRLEG